MFFTTVNPMEVRNSTGETPRDFTKPRIAPYKNTWKRNQNTVCWCNVKFAQEKGLQFHQTRSHAVVLCNTQPAACIEKAVCMKTKEELDELNSKMANGLYSKRIRTAVNKIHKAKTQDHLGNHQAICGKICNNTVDHRIYGVPLSAIEQQNTTRETKVQKLIEKFENHKHKESLSIRT